MNFYYLNEVNDLFNINIKFFGEFFYFVVFIKKIVVYIIMYIVINGYLICII